MCIHSYTNKYNPSSLKAIATIYDAKCLIHSDNKLASSKQCTTFKSSKHLELALKEMWWQVTSLLYQYILNVYSLNSQQKINNRFFCTGSFLLKTKQKTIASFNFHTEQRTSFCSQFTVWFTQDGKQEFSSITICFECFSITVFIFTFYSAQKV